MPKAKKDPNKPKGIKSAYICFTECERKDCEKNGVEYKFTDFSTMCGAKWKKMAEEDKAPFVKLSGDDRKRHEKEMESYIPPSDSDSDEDKPKKKKKKKITDPNAPKRHVTAYFHFAAHIRPTIKEENPKLSITDMAKLMGVKWRELSKEEKEPYEKKAADDKERYLREMEEYNQSK